MKETLADVYAEVPDPGCKGLCRDACTTVGLFRAERPDLEGKVRSFEEATVDNVFKPCPSLTILGRCAAYNTRPLICRLYGAVEGLRCEHGCMPEGGYITDERARALMVRASKVRR